MKHINKIQIKNFQSHRDTTIDLDKNFNCIIGSTDSGKSVIIRALRFCLFNDAKAGFIRHNCNSAKVKITFDNETQVLREKGKKVNKYSLKELDKDTQTYEDFGKEIPQEILDVMNMNLLQFDIGDEININIASQFDKFFLIQETNSVKSKVLGRLTGAHIIDHSIRELNKDKRNLGIEKKSKLEEIESTKERLKGYEGIEDRQKELDGIKGKIEGVEKDIETLGSYYEVRDLVEDFNVKSKIAKHFQERLGEVDVEKYEGVIEGVRDNIDGLIRLGELSGDIELNEKYSKENRDSKKDLTNFWNVCIIDLKKIGKCPTCFRDLKEGDVERIVQQI